MRLLLYRHAKSDWSNADLSDIDRSLNSRGKAAAAAMARYMKAEGLLPNQILCSTAQRTRETLSRLLPHLTHEAKIYLLSDIYNQSEDDYAGLIRKHGGRAHTLMVLGHNPASEETALELTGTADEAAKADLEEKFPTAALAVLDFDIADWSELRPGTGHLARFVKPRALNGHPPQDDN
ncbi:MAG: histidine phosphatase family protein [Roseibium sp.]|uniref:SixA phosphatase family protein n=1 Tax=Roseibium sp. TaxID=1936156 RepID=UPI001B247CD6|nr:histidine phosphatase family protein [Roseibium sp.]MBO6893277.1 histidine phosphatase family protein [Roseibium sp.]